jgi:protocatechuate 3,4-dioxygenase beta subunit
MRGLRATLLPVACCAGLVVIAQPGGVQPAAADQQCPTSNGPNTLTLTGGSPQTAERGTAFTAGLQVALANTNGCPLTTPLAGTAIVFTAPASGASGTFTASGTNTLTVGADASGMATAAGFTANDLTGTYTLTASSAYGTVSFTLTNSGAGVAATIAAVTPTRQSASVGARYARPLAVRVRDADGTPVAGANVTFTLGSGGAHAAAGASFAGGSSQATATTGADGVATSPRLTADTTTGAFGATASTTGVAATVRFDLRNRAGRPAVVGTGAGSSQAAPTGRRFTIPLAVQVTDAHNNPVAGARVTFTAPSSGPSGHFSRRSHPTRVTVRTDASGIAVAPPFVANSEQGGYVVTATVRGAARAAAFALVNDAS